MTAVLPETDALRRLADKAGDELEGASAIEVLQWADEHLGETWCVTSSMADAVVPHLASRVRPGVDVVFLDTGYHFAETIGTRDAVAATLPVTVRTITPRQSVEQQDASFGVRLYERNPDQCCALRKVTPLRQALKDYRGWASGLRRDETHARTDIRLVEWDARRSMVKLNPIAAWTQLDVDQYIADNGVLVNPLMYDGYGSIGCGPCTRRIKPGEDLRAGRWAGTSKTECGIHDQVVGVHPNCVAVDAALEAAGCGRRVQMLPEPAPTAAAAAGLVGVEVGAIANSLIFATAEDEPVLVLTSGAHRVDTGKVAALVGTSALKRANPDFVLAATGQRIGGVAPVGHPAPLRTVIDVALAEFPQVWAAGGIPHAVFPTTYDELLRLTGAQPAEVA